MQSENPEQPSARLQIIQPIDRKKPRRTPERRIPNKRAGKESLALHFTRQDTHTPVSKPDETDLCTSLSLYLYTSRRSAASMIHKGSNIQEMGSIMIEQMLSTNKTGTLQSK